MLLFLVGLIGAVLGFAMGALAGGWVGRWMDGHGWIYAEDVVGGISSIAGLALGLVAALSVAETLGW